MYTLNSHRYTEDINSHIQTRDFIKVKLVQMNQSLYVNYRICNSNPIYSLHFLFLKCPSVSIVI